jgi:hypothetical protein
MLLTLLAAVSSVTFLASAVLAAKNTHAAIGGYVLAIIIGLLLAACNAWVVYKAGEHVANLTSSSSFFLAILLWLPLAAFLGNWVALVVMRFAA